MAFSDAELSSMAGGIGNMSATPTHRPRFPLGRVLGRLMLDLSGNWTLPVATRWTETNCFEPFVSTARSKRNQLHRF